MLPQYAVVRFRPLEFYWLSRVPLPVEAFNNVFRPFQASIWLLVFAAQAIAAAYFVFQTEFYRLFYPESGLVKANVGYKDIIPKTFHHLIGADSLDFMPGMSLGKWMIGLYTLFSMLIMAFYTNTLRSNMIKPVTEPRIDDSHVRNMTLLQKDKGRSIGGQGGMGYGV